MARLGVLLVRAGAVTEESVNRALAIQGFAGGRLGTLLIERGSASEDDIGKALADQQNCEYIPWRVLGEVPPSVTAALPPKFAIRHSAVPVELGEGYIRIVIRDPANLRILDELFFVTGKKIIPAVAPEVRIYQALEKYYGERRTPRFAILAEKLSRPIAPSVIKKPLPPPPDFSATRRPLPGERPPPAPAPDEDPPILQTWKILDTPPVGWGGLTQPTDELQETAEPESIPWEEMPTRSWPTAPPDEVRPRTPGTSTAPAASLESSSPWRPAPVPPREPPPEPAKPRIPQASDFTEILAARGRNEIFEKALQALALHFRTSAIFAVRREGVTGWAGAGDRVNVVALGAVDIPWAEPSIFLNVRLSRSFYLGPLPPLPRHRELAAAVGGWPTECLVQPVLMREKSVAFFYAECAGAQGATPVDLAFARQLASATAEALAASILLKKKQVI